MPSNVTLLQPAFIENHRRGLSRTMERLAMTVATALAILAASPAAGGAEKRGQDLLRDPQQHGMAALYAQWPGIAANYVTAMMRYRTAAEHEGMAPQTYPFILVDRPPFGGPWTWTAANGSLARRTRDGAFHLSLADGLGNWFAEINCHDAGWPAISCDDMVDRVARAPNPSRLIIDGVEFDRKLPSSEVPEPAVGDGSGPEVGPE